MKSCNTCHEELPLDRFHKNGTSRDGLQHTCKSCMVIKMREWRKKNPGKQSEMSRRYRESEKGQLVRTAYRETKREQSRNGRLLRRYGITSQQYEELYAAQAGICPICLIWYEKLFVDHCHKTNQRRDLLCNTCNLGIGGLKDDTDILKRAIEYLERWQGHEQGLDPI